VIISNKCIEPPSVTSYPNYEQLITIPLTSEINRLSTLNLSKYLKPVTHQTITEMCTSQGKHRPNSISP